MSDRPRLTLRMIHSRCEEVGECLLWTGAASGSIPRASHQNRPVSLRRLVLAMSRGKPIESIPTHLLCVPKCGNDLCLRERHLVLRTKKDHQMELAKLGVYSRPDVVAARAAACRKGPNAKLTEELAQWARESPQTAADAAWGLGVCKQNVYLIRQNKAWTNVASVPATSVFEFRGAIHLHEPANPQEKSVVNRRTYAGGNNPNAKLSEEQQESIFRRYVAAKLAGRVAPSRDAFKWDQRTGRDTVEKIAKDFGIAREHVYRVAAKARAAA